MYRAPLKDLRFVLDELLGESAIRSGLAEGEYSAETSAAILEEGAKFAEEILDPINKLGDRQGAVWTADGVKMPAEFKAAYQQFVAGGWTQLGASAEFGGQGMPLVLGTAVDEMWAAANLAFKLCPMLTKGAVEALEQYGSKEQQHTYIPKMVSGEWAGTMNLTEPQAGSDLGAIRTRATPDGEQFRIFGQKIFITYGDHDYTPNIIQMVLARIDGAPAGVRGISLFIVPKVLVNSDGTLGKRNDVRCVSIEHKLGIHASPTCVLAYGDAGGAVGHLVGEANRGLEYMFVMMNAARLSVGLEGYALAERAYQQAADWAKTRVQGKPPGAPASNSPAPIVHHPDVKRMLLTMKSHTEAMRALALYAAHQLDLAAGHADSAVRAKAQMRGELLIPIVKAWSTESGIEIASLGIQVHGGMGFIEETGAAQLLRDVRITSIYEGTTGIQANDLIGRKLGRDRGGALAALLDDIEAELSVLSSSHATVASCKAATLQGVTLLRSASTTVLAALATDPKNSTAVAVPFLMLCGTVCGGWLMTRAAGIAAAQARAQPADAGFYTAKLATARFYAAHLAPRALGLAAIVNNGASSINDATADIFS
jgi:3-(methylthio)propanoyl-CoA dehydrogenase